MRLRLLLLRQRLLELGLLLRLRRLELGLLELGLLRLGLRELLGGPSLYELRLWRT